MITRDFNTLPDEAHISIKEAIQLAGISRSTLYRMINSNTFPAPVYKSAARTGAVKFSLGAVRHWLKHGNQEVT